MSSAPTPAQIVRDPHWLAQALDPATGLLRFVSLSPEDYRSASFLDDRLFRQSRDTVFLPWATVASEIPGDARRDAGWIFHIGHVGSTLVARLLGELDGVLAVREPRILRDLAAMPAGDRQPFLAASAALLSRTFDANQIALVKATSFASEIAADIVPAGGRALLLGARPDAYIATILAGDNSRREIAQLAELRGARLAGRGIALPDARRDDAHLAAAAWAAEAVALEAAAEAIGPDRTRFAGFDTMLSDMPVALADAAAFFGIEAPPERIGEIVAGPLMRQYSKAPEFDYSPQLRSDLLAEASTAHAAQIQSALAMLAAAADGSPLLKRALERF